MKISDFEAPADPATPVVRQVLINDLEVIASIGIYEHEQRYLQRVIVTLVLWVRDDYDGHSDSIQDVYDYDHAVNAVRQTLDDGHTNLIETAAHRIAEQCLDHGDVQGVRVRIEKPDVLPGCRSIGIEIERHRDAL